MDAPLIDYLEEEIPGTGPDRRSQGRPVIPKAVCHCREQSGVPAMAISGSELQVRIDEFQQDLGRLEVIHVIRKHITTGPSVVLQDGDYYDLRNEVASHFQLHPSAVVVVGSCRTGFPASSRQTLTCPLPVHLRRGPGRSFPRERFENFWDLVFEQWRSDRLWAGTSRYHGFLRGTVQCGGCGPVDYPLQGDSGRSRSGSSSRTVSPVNGSKGSDLSALACIATGAA